MSITCVTADSLFRPDVTGQISETEQTVTMVFMITSLIWIAVNFVVFLYYKNRFSRTKVRVGVFTGNYFMAVVTMVFGWMMPVAVGIDQFPCWLTYALTAMSIGYFNATNFTRNSTFMLMTGLSFATQSNGRISLEEIAKEEENQRNMLGLNRIKEELSLIWFGLKFVFTPNAVKGKKSQQEHMRTLVALRFITSLRGSLLFTNFCLAPYMVLIIAMCLSIPAYREGCTGCIPDSRAVVYTVVSLGGVLLAFALMFNLKCSKLPDVWGVFFEETLAVGWLALSFLSLLLMSFADVPQKYMLNIMFSVAFSIAFFTASGYQIFYAWKQERIQVRLLPSPINAVGAGAKQPSASSYVPSEATSVSTGGGGGTIVSDIKSSVPNLQEILSNPHLVRAFEIHILQEFCDENLNFLQNLHEWKIVFNDIARTASTARARKIVNTFIREGGLQQINVSYDLASRLVQRADRGEVFDVDAFNNSRLEVARLLETGAVTRFLRSDIYRNIISGDLVLSAVSGENNNNV